MAVQNYNTKKSPGFRSPFNYFNPETIFEDHAPTANNLAPEGTWWIDNVGIAAYVNAKNGSGVANWLSLQPAGGAGVFSSLVVTPGPISLTGTTTINTSGSGVTTIGTGGTGAVNIGNATGNTAVTGSLTASTGLVATTGGITATGTSNINTSGAAVTSIGTGGTGAVNIGNATGDTAVTGDLSVTAQLGSATLVVTGDTQVGGASGSQVLIGNSNAATDVTIQAGTDGIILNASFLSISGIFFYVGAGAPGNPLAVHIGDVYVRTDAGGATERMYIATAVGAWTNVTCAA